MPAEVLATLVELSEEINSSLDLDEVLRKTAAIVKRLVDYEIFSVMLLDENTQKLYHRFTIGYGDEASKDWQIPDRAGNHGHCRGDAARGSRARCSRRSPVHQHHRLRSGPSWWFRWSSKGNRSACWTSRARKSITLRAISKAS